MPTERRSPFVEYRGCRLAYAIEGEGPPVVFIQGVGVHGRGWSPQVDVLGHEFACLTFDNREMGASVPLGAPLTVRQMAADTARIMDEIGWQTAHLVAHSLGGPVALEMALSTPGRVRSLSLLCTVARGRDATRLTRRILWIGLRTRVGTRPMRRRAFLELVMPPGELAARDADALAAALELIFGHDLADTPPVAMRQLKALRDFDATARLAELPPHLSLRRAAEYAEAVRLPCCNPSLGCLVSAAARFHVAKALD